jgi:tetratricopeptide (TPR) repeat protein
MLLDRQLLVRDGNVYRVVGDIDQLEVPDTLHALVAARLDALPFEERRLVECGAVLGKAFTRSGLAEVSGVSEPKLEPLLAGLLGKEILAVQADPRSPDRGHYSFLQDIVKQVAYETISRRERKAKHLAAAQFLASTWSVEEDEIVEVVAAHYLDAYRSAPDDDDALELKAKAFEMLVRAGERAASLGANTEAQRAFERASELTDDEVARAELLERAGMAAYVGGRVDAAAADFERAIELFESVGATHPAARVAARNAEISWDRGRIEQGLANMDQAFSVLSQEEPDADLAALAAQIGRFMLFAGQSELAFERIERSLEIAEMLSQHETLAQALNTKGILLIYRGRPTEGLALLRIALEIALEHAKPSAALRAYYNLADLNAQGDHAREAAELHRDGLALARKVGNRYWEWSFIGTAYPLYLLGEWDEVISREADLPEDDWTQVRIAFTSLMSALVPTRVHRGQLDKATHLKRFLGELETSADVQEVALRCASEAILFFAEERYDDALDRAQTAFDLRYALSANHEAVREGFVVAVDAALALGDQARAEELLAVIDSMPVGLACTFLRAHCARFHARLAARSGDREGADRLLEHAAGVFRELEYPFYLGVTLVEHGELLVAQDNHDEAGTLLREAHDLFQRLQARPWIERVARAQAITSDVGAS